MIQLKKNPFVLGCFIALTSCIQDHQPSQFTALNSDQTGISFVNSNTETEADNILTFEYFYNGGGVAVGDINNDGLADIYFSSNQGQNKLYRNKGYLKFEDISESAGVTSSKGWKTGISMVDINNDGWLDLYVCRSKESDPQNRKNQLYINNGDETFTERAQEFGLDDDSYSTHAAFFDFDNDGDLDAFLLNHSLLQISNAYKINESKSNELYEPEAFVSNKLLINTNGKFVDASETLGLNSNPSNFGLGICLSDINNDGFTDIYTSCDYTGSDKLWLNKKGKSVQDATDSLLSHLSLFSMGVDIADVNSDGYADILTLDMLPPDNTRQKQLFVPDRYEVFQNMVSSGLHYQYMRNMLHLNNGDGSFSEIGQLAGLSSTDWSWAPLIADFDNDGLQDVFVSNSFKRDFTNNDFLKYRADQQLKNQGMVNHSLYSALIKNLPTHTFHNYIFKNNDNLVFSDKSYDWGFEQSSTTNGVAYADLDNDGDLDLIANNLNQNAIVYQNNADKIGSFHYLKVQLEGTQSNGSGIGAKVIVYSSGKKEQRELFPVRGFISSIEPTLHFGLGNSLYADSVTVQWPSGIYQTISNISADQLITIKEEATSNFIGEEKAESLLFKKITTNITYKHRENEFIDFKIQPLLPRAYSADGPALAIDDVNKDGLNDIFVGGAKDQAAELWVQLKNGQYKKLPIQDFIQDAASEDVGAEFIDADNDGDQDLYVVSGGYEFEVGDKKLQDRLYLNDGHGNYRRTRNALPDSRESGSCVKPIDFDVDGDLDLFIGGRIVHGRYPENPKSTLLINNGKGIFSDQSNIILKPLGMVTDALWTDLNGDNRPDLIVVGEWMPIQFLLQENGQLVDKTNTYLKNSPPGWWNCIAQADLDHDNDLDLVIGNVGLNNQMKATSNRPVTLQYADFDNNGSIDPILSHFIQGKNFPYANRDELNDQLPIMKKRFLSYGSYSAATTENLFSEEELRMSKTLTATSFETLVLINQHNTSFQIQALPIQAQFAPVIALALADVNHDGNLDIITGGNESRTRVRTGKLSGNPGFVFLGNGNGTFNYLSPTLSGIHEANVDIRKIKINDGHLYMSTNDGPIMHYNNVRKP